MFIVKTKFWAARNNGYGEKRIVEDSWRENGPFVTSDSAEQFARNIATAKDIAQVEIAWKDGEPWTRDCTKEHPEASS